MSEMHQEENCKIANFGDFDWQLQNLFGSRLGLDKNGVFKEKMTKEEAQRKLKEANQWYTGKDLILSA